MLHHLRFAGGNLSNQHQLPLEAEIKAKAVKQPLGENIAVNWGYCPPAHCLPQRMLNDIAAGSGDSILPNTDSDSDSDSDSETVELGSAGNTLAVDDACLSWAHPI